MAIKKKISQFPNATTVTGADILTGIQSGVNKNMSIQQIADYVIAQFLPALSTPASNIFVAGSGGGTQSWGNVANEVGFEARISQGADMTNVVQTATLAANVTSKVWTSLIDGQIYTTDVMAIGDMSNYKNSARSNTSSDTPAAMPLNVILHGNSFAEGVGSSSGNSLGDRIGIKLSTTVNIKGHSGYSIGTSHTASGTVYGTADADVIANVDPAKKNVVFALEGANSANAGSGYTTSSYQTAVLSYINYLLANGVQEVYWFLASPAGSRDCDFLKVTNAFLRTAIPAIIGAYIVDLETTSVGKFGNTTTYPTGLHYTFSNVYREHFIDGLHYTDKGQEVMAQKAVDVYNFVNISTAMPDRSMYQKRAANPGTPYTGFAFANSNLVMQSNNVYAANNSGTYSNSTTALTVGQKLHWIAQQNCIMGLTYNDVSQPLVPGGAGTNDTYKGVRYSGTYSATARFYYDYRADPVNDALVYSGDKVTLEMVSTTQYKMYINDVLKADYTGTAYPNSIWIDMIAAIDATQLVVSDITIE